MLPRSACALAPWLPVLLVTLCLTVDIRGQSEVKPPKPKNETVRKFNCIVCDDLTNKFCEPWDHFSHTKDCYQDDRINKTLPIGCRKMVQTIGTKTYVSRQCTNLVDDNIQGCIDRVGTKKIKVMYCHCRTPECNSANSIASGSWAAMRLLSPVGAVLLILLGAR